MDRRVGYHSGMKIYTKRGDSGETDLFSAGAEGMRRVAKDSLRIEAIGTVDELNSLVGLVVAAGPEKNISDALIEIQKDLFVLGADLATPGIQPVRGASDVPRVSEKRVVELEGLIDRLELDLAPMTAFILPGGSEFAARLHVCRSVCRRAERVCVALVREENTGEMSVKFLNRLSDLFFTMARYENVKKGIEETKWMPGS